MGSRFKQFATPHCHPASLDTASSPKEFAEREVELGGIALTCTDHGTLQAAYTIYDLAKKKGLIPIVGLESYWRDDSCPILLKHGIARTTTKADGYSQEQWNEMYPHGTFIDYAKYFHGTMHFMDFEAYRTAVKILSKADLRAEVHGSERKPLFTWDDLEELASKNVTMGSSCLVGMTMRHFLTDRVEAPIIAEDYFKRLHHLFKDRFFVEVFPHVCTHDYKRGIYLETENLGRIQYWAGKQLRTELGEITAEELAASFKAGKKHEKILAVKNYRKWIDLEEPTILKSVELVEGFIQNECTAYAPDGDVQLGANKWVLEMAAKYGVPCMTSDDRHFVTPEAKIVQDVRLFQMSGGRWKFHGSYHAKSSEEAYEYFQSKLGIDEVTYCQWIDNSLAWAEKFRGFKFDTTPSLPTKFFPQDTLKHTKYLIEKHGRLDKSNKKYVQRLAQELKTIHKNGKIDLLPYFFIIEEIVRVYESENQVIGVGRGSAAGSLLSYVLGITSVDPIKNDLSFDRFLTLDRILSGSLPDIDTDFPNRDLLLGGYETEVIDFVASDGTSHSVPASFRVETAEGDLPIKEVINKGLDFKEWWMASQ